MVASTTDRDENIMCGIAGVLTQHGDAAARALALHAMQTAVRHRGPDDAGTWTAASGAASFAHTRLAILDPTPAGHQPMSTPDDQITIAFNGEIVNFQELRRSLKQRGVCFRTQSDTEVILRAYETDGLAALHSLRGMFALAIWDARESLCLLARDPFGIKPLYYHQADGVLTFASEMGALLAGGVPPLVDPAAAFAYFRSGSVPEPLTITRNVRALEAGHYLIWRNGQTTIQRYWGIEFPETIPADDPAAVTRAALIDSVAQHLVSDVPVGIFLSGGMDSTAILALARTIRGGELRTFSLAFPDFPLDEGPLARRTAARFDTEHHEWAVNGPTAAELFDQFLTAADQPSIDGFNTFLVARLAQRHDTKVVLSGLGGDELFGGYPSFRRVPRLAQLARLGRLGRPLSTAALRMAGGLGGSRVRRLDDLISRPASLENAYVVFRGIYSGEEAAALTNHYVGPHTVIEPPREEGSAPTAEDLVSHLELTRYMRNQLLRDSDVMSMAAGVEVRVPFVDRVLFETLARVPAAERLQRGKALLRRAVPELPDWVAGQPKRGFVLPFQQWLERDWSRRRVAINPPPGIVMDTHYRKWSVLAFERWLQRVSPGHV